MNIHIHYATRSNYDLNIKKLRALLKHYCNPLPDAPEDEYDSIVLQLILMLIRNESVSEMSRNVSDEFKQKWGIVISKDQAIMVSFMFVRWWYCGALPSGISAG